MDQQNDQPTVEQLQAALKAQRVLTDLAYQEATAQMADKLGLKSELHLLKEENAQLKAGLEDARNHLVRAKEHQEQAAANGAKLAKELLK